MKLCYLVNNWLCKSCYMYITAQTAFVITTFLFPVSSTTTIIIIYQMWNLWLPVPPACITELAHEEAHSGGLLQLHLRVLQQEVREAGQRQIPQAKESSRKAGNLNCSDTPTYQLAIRGRTETSSKERHSTIVFVAPLMSMLMWSAFKQGRRWIGLTAAPGLSRARSDLSDLRCCIWSSEEGAQFKTIFKIPAGRNCSVIFAALANKQ